MHPLHLARLSAAMVLLASLCGAAEAQDRRVKIINETSYEIREFYGSHVGTRSWQEDILGRDTLPSGASVTINFDDGTGYCKFDFKAVFSDGDEVVRENINVCEIGTYRYTD